MPERIGDPALSGWATMFVRGPVGVESGPQQYFKGDLGVAKTFELSRNSEAGSGW